MDVEGRTIPGLEAQVLIGAGHANITCAGIVEVPAAAEVLEARVFQQEGHIGTVLGLLHHIIVGIQQTAVEAVLFVIVHRHRLDGCIDLCYDSQHCLRGFVVEAATLGTHVVFLRKILQGTP